MPLYEANVDKQKPIVKDGRGFFSHATCPAVETKTKRPTYIMINQPGAYAFSYENTPTNYITASIIAGCAPTPTGLVKYTSTFILCFSI